VPDGGPGEPLTAISPRIAAWQVRDTATGVKVVVAGPIEALAIRVVADECFPLSLEHPPMRSTTVVTKAHTEKRFESIVLNVTLSLAVRFHDRTSPAIANTVELPVG